jgi:stearoyl-CoA desaturase (Delta-9 desaturase)
MRKSLFKQIDWVSTLFLTLTPILTIPLTIYYFQTETFNYWMIPIFIFFYYAMGLSITGGYHRLFAHCAYEAPAIIRFLYLFFGAGAYQNSARKWVIDHRLHHRYVDREKDPYSINKGFWYAHFFWMCLKEEWRESDLAKPYTKDLDKDRLIVLQDRYYFTIATFSCFVVPAIVGWAFGSWVGGLLFGGLLRMVVVHHFTFFINSACHYWGRQPYTDQNTARDNGFLALFTYGEGYHNFHHIFHADYRNGIRWYHYDPTKWLIRFMSFFKLANNLKVTPDFEIFKAKMQMAEKKLRNQKDIQWNRVEWILENFKKRAEEANQRFWQLHRDYETIKNGFSAPQQIQQLRVDLRQAQKDLEQICNQWKRCLKKPTYS